MWKTAKDFSDLITLNQKFLLGHIPETPFHCGPIDEETIPLVPGLLELHKFGLFTIGSQPYEQVINESTKGYDECQQRPYVAFIITGKDGLYLDFFNKLKERADVSSVELCPFKILDGSPDSHVVSRNRTASTVKDLETAEWGKDSTTVRSSEDVSAELDLPDAMKSVQPVLFNVVASEWGVQLDLLRVIKEVAIDCGLPRM